MNDAIQISAHVHLKDSEADPTTFHAVVMRFIDSPKFEELLIQFQNCINTQFLIKLSQKITTQMRSELNFSDLFCVCNGVSGVEDDDRVLIFTFMVSNIT